MLPLRRRFDPNLDSCWRKRDDEETEREGSYETLSVIVKKKEKKKEEKAKALSCPVQSLPPSLSGPNPLLPLSPNQSLDRAFQSVSPLFFASSNLDNLSLPYRRHMTKVEPLRWLFFNLF